MHHIGNLIAKVKTDESSPSLLFTLHPKYSFTASIEAGRQATRNFPKVSRGDKDGDAIKNARHLDYSLSAIRTDLVDGLTHTRALNECVPLYEAQVTEILDVSKKNLDKAKSMTRDRLKSLYEPELAFLERKLGAQDGPRIRALYEKAITEGNLHDLLLHSLSASSTAFQDHTAAGWAADGLWKNLKTPQEIRPYAQWQEKEPCESHSALQAVDEETMPASFPTGYAQ